MHTSFLRKRSKNCFSVHNYWKFFSNNSTRSISLILDYFTAILYCTCEPVQSSFLDFIGFVTFLDDFLSPSCCFMIEYIVSSVITGNSHSCHLFSMIFVVLEC